MTKLKILFVCTGNICRSPLAEAVLREYVMHNNLAAEIEIDSCGTSSYHVGSLPDQRAINVARKHNMRLTHKARQITQNDLEQSNYILVMDHLNYEDVLSRIKDSTAAGRVFLLRSFDLATTVDYDVPDPYYGTDADFEDVLYICRRAVDGFINYLVSENQLSS